MPFFLLADGLAPHPVFVENHNVDAAILRPPFRRVVRGDRDSVRIAADRVEASVEATPIRDAVAANEVVEKFRAKYGAADVERYYPKHDVAVEVPLGEDVGRG